jgi:hypothetical protein
MPHGRAVVFRGQPGQPQTRGDRSWQQRRARRSGDSVLTPRSVAWLG